jgi:hypothetical protein
MNDQMMTRHAQVRSQQRGIPVKVQSWLVQYGDRVHDHRGAVLRFFSKRSLRRLERAEGAPSMRALSKHLRCYMVQAVDDGAIITMGIRHAGRRINRV